MNKRRLYAKTKTFAIFKRMFLSIVYKLEMEYWVLHCGCDGYLYLLFQRQMFRLSCYLSAIMLTFSFVMNMGDDESNTTKGKDESKSNSMTFIYKALLSNRELSHNRSWLHVLMLFVITFLTIGIVR